VDWSKTTNLGYPKAAKSGPRQLFMPMLGVRQLARFFGGVSADSQKKLRQHVVDQLCEATGGPCIYTGRTMKASLTGLGISESDWQLAVQQLIATLDKFKVPEKEKNELLTIASSLKQDIVEKK
jgi:hemoglobin